VRNVFVVGPDKKIKLVVVYPMTTGRNFDEAARGRLAQAHAAAALTRASAHPAGDYAAS
jgi:alkyl hydroperoxide reductase subunit AhpC